MYFFHCFKYFWSDERNTTFFMTSDVTHTFNRGVLGVFSPFLKQIVYNSLIIKINKHIWKGNALHMKSKYYILSRSNHVYVYVQ